MGGRDPLRESSAGRYVALIGRPNTGKSTLFNRLVGKRSSLVANFPKLTRDRSYAPCLLQGGEFVAIDTGGIEDDGTPLTAEVSHQAWLAAAEADLALLVVDAREGLNDADRDIHGRLRKRGIEVIVAANKIDGLDAMQASGEFFDLGAPTVAPISALRGNGVKELVTLIHRALPEESPLPPSDSNEDEGEDAAARIAVIGRPNTGKSTLINRLLKERRLVVGDQPGTTRDSVRIPWQYGDNRYVLIDTAGVRRRSKVSEAIEKFSVVKTLRAIDGATAVIVLLDGVEGIVEQDLRLIGMAAEAGRSLVIAVNKWDAVENERRALVKSELSRRLRFLPFAKVRHISALRGRGLAPMLSELAEACEGAQQKIGSAQLNEILARALRHQPPPMLGRHRIKLRHAHPGGRNPPRVIVHGNRADKVPDSYRRYLEGYFVKALQLQGTPLKVELRATLNPFAEKRNRLTPRQAKSRLRVIRRRKSNR